MTRKGVGAGISEGAVWGALGAGRMQVKCVAFAWKKGYVFSVGRKADAATTYTHSGSVLTQLIVVFYRNSRGNICCVSPPFFCKISIL
jgi:hypothetical protein